MKAFFTFIFCIFFISSFAQEEIKIFNEKNNSGYILYASNSAFCPISMSLDMKLENLNFSDGQDKIFVIPAKAEKFELGELKVIDRANSNKFSLHYRYDYGSVNITAYDSGYEYDLPYQTGKSFFIFQGYNGRFSHQNENSLDFTMPEGTEITAARDGVVIKVVQSNTESCLSKECAQFNNYIMTYHSDGTLAVYAHIKYNGSAVKAGDSVKKGDLLGYSGNTGWSSGPHLHFSCFLPDLVNRKTIKTKFRITNGSKSEYLQEKERYRKDY